jgi:cytochrome c peroxidase
LTQLVLERACRPTPAGATKNPAKARCTSRRAVRSSGLACWALLAACRSTDAPAPRAGAEGLLFSASTAEPIEPIPLEVDVDVPRATLGEALFFSTIVSADARVSCGSCHALKHGLADRSPVSEVAFRPKTPMNSTTLFNVRFFDKVTWTGRFASLESQLDALIKAPKLMGSSWADVTARVEADRSWTARFRAVFADGVTEANVRAVLLEYERSLITPNAPFDRWLRGDKRSLSLEAQRGYELFRDYGCISCHQGIALGANMFERFGVMRPYFGNVPTTEADFGRFNVTHREDDRYVFRVPTLRNVALTPPYFHNGLAPTLDEAVRVMAEVQLGRELAPSEIRAIVAFLESLTGEYRGKAL